jgi:hypothetical protein
VPQDKADIEDPMAWLAFATDGSESCAVYVTDGEAQAAAEAWGWQVLPLYLAARLADAEREAVRFFVTASLPETQKLGGVAGELCMMHAAALRGLLERMGGDE